MAHQHVPRSRADLVLWANVTIKAVGGKAGRLWPLAAIAAVIAVAGISVWILGREVITERELDELDRAARSYIADPRTVMLPVLYFTTWGRKPR